MANNATPAGATAMLNGLASPMVLKLHTADPTDAGTAAVSVQYPAGVSVAFAAAAAGARATSADAVWAAGAGTETITHVSVWNTGATSCLFQGPLTAPVAVNAEPFTIDAGDLSISAT